LVKLCVGCDSVQDLIDWWRATHGSDEPWMMTTRQTPKRAAELVDGGSLYRVYKGFILSRQRILAVETVAGRCQVTLDPAIVLTVPTPRRAFQGWRYLQAKDAPGDLGVAGGETALPLDLTRRLREIGAW
jgi:hypothetical protein